MAVPRFVRRQNHIFIAGALALAGLAAFETWPAFGQQRSSNSRIAPSERMPLGGPAIDPADERAPDPTHLAAARLLAVARQDLAQGRAEIAQRVLEHLVARYPGSPSVGDAMRELDSIYAARRATAPQQSAASAAPPRPEVSAWRTTVVRFAKPQEELRNGIGDRVFFSSGSAELGSRARAVIAAQAEWLQHRPELDVVVEGHADDAGVAADEDKLSASRAIAVRDRLAAEGVAPARIRILPQGARDPIATCDDGSCSAQNRRVVVQVALPPVALPPVALPPVALPKSQAADNPFEAAGNAAGIADRPR